MSSEMRELVKRWRERANSLYLERDNESDTKAHGIDDCADDLRALLARTEAGADGAVAHIHDYGDRVRVVWDKPWGDFPVGTQFYTHPQGASGDARPAIFDEASDRVAFVDAHIWPENGFKNVWVTAAMQAKEAK